MTGDMALHLVKLDKINPSEIWIIQEDTSATAEELMLRGAIAKILFCCESPLFAADFYLELPLLSGSFEHCMAFRGALTDAHPRVGKHVMWFPSFDATEEMQPMPWNKKMHLVMVAGNKYWMVRRTFWRAIAAGVRDALFRYPQRFSKVHASMQLHDRRLALIAHFGARGELDLFGHGWDDLTNLPLHWQQELKELIRNLNPKICEDKQKVISHYKFSICMENIDFPGYVTEKIIDSLYAGVIPVYWGAPDVADYVPEGCYVDARKFRSLTELSEYLHLLTEVQAIEMIHKGQSFLRGEGANMFSFSSFAARIDRLLTSK